MRCAGIVSLLKKYLPMLLYSQPSWNIHPVNLFILSGIVQSVIVAGILLFTKNGNRQANRLLSVLTIVCSLHFSWTMVIDTNIDAFYDKILWFPYSYILAIGPLLYLYTRSLTTPQFRINFKHIVHFLPAWIELSTQVLLINTHDLPFYYYGPAFTVFRIIEFTACGISITYYSRQSLIRIKAHENWLAENFSNTKDLTLTWLRTFIKYLRMVWLIWLAFELSFMIFWHFRLHHMAVYALLYVLLGVVTYSVYWIAIQALIKSQTLIDYKAAITPAPNPSVYARLSNTEINSTIDALNHLMQTEKLYLHDTLTLRTLATRLQKDPNLVSHILNTHFKKTFHDYINEHRVNEVKARIQNPSYAHLKLIEIAYDCGFNSKATFNRVFKNQTGTSPSSYKPKP
jgi:AraC-like DNA-binding protein